ncbi:MBL fold metallo-hydrolase [Thermosipho atlanticus]|uniref:7,8-dihydropterin-6-yl-methyl-4-(Beta-D-ribofuranosyl)aminobenzene 5'-phosphate synthase n=1 Tax=Thermosipho atlanticus DSM 15807 TaxID=1123380 RepID=A0A1M5SNI2_9BACT|nr:MBL fold metallo-hydrolase [Thermosipho atlanticus]SHH39838.1 7,8-dihydropterin-6-yl-methyl-4-(beta-D-ribofuranosyl)aminobenzene 5'-phosphate synthase [Thermosipho atlanticus DSM 15807]
MKVWVLVNDKSEAKYGSEHGFSVFVKYGDKKILFDTGQSNLFFENAKKLGLNLRKLDAVVISHGHYDHGNGLEYLLKETGPKQVFVGRGFFNHRYSEKRYVGLRHNREYYEKLGGEFRVVEKDFELFKGIKIVTAAPMITFEQPEKRFRIEDEFKKLKQDLFEDELYLSIGTSDGIVVITGCSHRGIVNIVSHLSKNGKIKAVIGGFHLLNKTDNELYKISKSLNTFHVESIYPCHCTGSKAINILKKNLKAKVEECLTGSFLEFDGGN